MYHSTHNTLLVLLLRNQPGETAFVLSNSRSSVVLHVPLPCSFFGRFVLSSCIASFAFPFAALLSFVADSVILLFRLGATPPPALLAGLKHAYSPYVLSSVVFLAFRFLMPIRTYSGYVFFSSSFPFIDSDLDIVCFILYFLVGTMLSSR